MTEVTRMQGIGSVKGGSDKDNVMGYGWRGVLEKTIWNKRG